MDIYYVYVYLNPLKPGKYVYGDIQFECEPFYIGKGKNLRMYSHLKMNRKNNIKNGIIKKILNENKTPIIIKLYENLSEQTALDIECDLIKKMGRISTNTGCLSNLTDGGEGHSGFIQSEATKIQRTESLKASTFYHTVRSEEFKKKCLILL